MLMDVNSHNEADSNVLQGACTCRDCCVFPGLLDLVLSFKKMSESEKAGTIKAILLSLTAPPGMKNKSMSRGKCSSTQARTLYVLRTQPVCYSVFLFVTGINHSTLERLNASVISTDGYVYPFSN